MIPTKSGQLIQSAEFPLVDHYGISIIENGKIYVLNNNFYAQKTIKQPWEDYKKNAKIKQITDTELTQQSNQEITERYQKVCKGNYRLWTYNCEQFIDCMLQQPLRSEQVVRWKNKGLLVLFGITIYTIYHKIKKQ